MRLIPGLKVLGALLIFLAWGVSTFFQEKARDAGVRFRSVNADLTALRRYTDASLDHQETAKDLAILTQMVSAAIAEEDVAQFSSLSLLQSLNAQSRTIRILKHSADRLAEFGRVLSDRAVLGDSIVALAKNIGALETAHTGFIASLLTMTTPAGALPQTVYTSAQQQQAGYLDLQHEREDELILFYSRITEEADAAAKRADTEAQLWFVFATLLFGSGTVLLLWHDLAEALKPKSAK